MPQCTLHNTVICQSYLSLANNAHSCRYRSRSGLRLRMALIYRPRNYMKELRKMSEYPVPHCDLSISWSHSAQQLRQISLIGCLCYSYVHKTFSTDQEHIFQLHLLHWLLYKHHVDLLQALRSAWYSYSNEYHETWLDYDWYIH
jgi:hypothetical protein